MGTVMLRGERGGGPVPDGYVAILSALQPYGRSAFFLAVRLLFDVPPPCARLQDDVAGASRGT